MRRIRPILVGVGIGLTGMFIVGLLAISWLSDFLDPTPPADVCQTAIAEAKQLQQPETQPQPYELQPNNIQPITVANAGQVQQLQRIGRGTVRKTFHAPNGDLLVLTTIGMWGHQNEPELLWEYYQGVDEFIVSPSGKLIAVKTYSFVSSIPIWDTFTGKTVVNLPTQDDGHLEKISFSADETRITASISDKIHVWDIQTGLEVKILVGATTPMDSIDIQSQNLFYPETKVYPLQFHDSGTLFALKHMPDSSVVLHPDGKTVLHIYPVGSYPTYISVCDLKTGERKKVIVSDETTNDIIFGPDERILTINEGRGTVKLLNATTYDEVAVFDITGAETWVITNQLAYNPDATILAFAVGDYTTGDFSIRLWDVQRRHELTKLEGHTDTVVGLSFSQDSKLLASSSRDGTIRLWGVPQT